VYVSGIADRSDSNAGCLDHAVTLGHACIYSLLSFAAEFFAISSLCRAV
jgi:hypothetical protein